MLNDSGRTIKKHLKDVYKRDDYAHQKDDTVKSKRIDCKRKSKHCFVTLAERKLRYQIALLSLEKEEQVTLTTIKALKKFPNELVKTTTFDRGKEFAGYEKIEKKSNCNIYF